MHDRHEHVTHTLLAASATCLHSGSNTHMSGTWSVWLPDQAEKILFQETVCLRLVNYETFFHVFYYWRIIIISKLIKYFPPNLKHTASCQVLKHCTLGHLQGHCRCQAAQIFPACSRWSGVGWEQWPHHEKIIHNQGEWVDRKKGYWKDRSSWHHNTRNICTWRPLRSPDTPHDTALTNHKFVLSSMGKTVRINEDRCRIGLLRLTSSV